MKFTKWCSEAVLRMVAAERRRARIRETVMRLEQLDARALRDIGLHPARFDRWPARSPDGMSPACSPRGPWGLPMASRLYPTRKELAP